MNSSCNLFIIGATGAGKTSLGRRLAAHYACTFVDLDQEIESTAGVNTSTIFAIEGEAGFRTRESSTLEKHCRRDGIVMATGAGVVLRPENRERLAASGFVVWLQATIDQQLERLKHDRSRPLLDGADRRQRLQVMADVREPLYRLTADLSVASAPGNSAKVCARCIALIDAHWQRPAAANPTQRRA